MKSLIQGGQVLTPDCEQFVSRDLVLNNDRIEAVVQPQTVAASEVDTVIDADGQLVIPGVINAHGHSYAGLLKGSMAPCPLDIYMQYAIASGTARSERAIYVSAMIDALQLLKNGVTAFVDHFAQRPVQEPAGIDAVVRAFEDSGLRAVVAPMYSDKPYDQTVPFEAGAGKPQGGNPPSQTPESYIRVCDEAIQRWNRDGSRVRVCLGTDGPQRCTDELLGLTRELEQQHQCGWQTHVLEAKTQAIMGKRIYGKGLVEHLADDLDLLNERTSLVHAIWLNEREIELVAEHNTAVVHCLRSNLYLGSGVAPVLQYRDADIPVALGTDGGNVGALEMFEVLRLSALMHRLYEVDYRRWPTASQTLKMAYDGGAQVMQLKGDIGVITSGAKADLTILNPSNLPHWWPRRDAVRQMVYYENGRSVDTVIVDGRVIVAGGELQGIDERALLQEAEQIARDLKLVGKEANTKGPDPETIERYRAMYLDAMQTDLGINRFHG